MSYVLRFKAKNPAKIEDKTSGLGLQNALEKDFLLGNSISWVGEFKYNACFVNFVNETGFTEAVSRIGNSCVLNIANIGTVTFEVSFKPIVGGSPSSTNGLKCTREDCQRQHPSSERK